MIIIIGRTFQLNFIFGSRYTEKGPKWQHDLEEQFGIKQNKMSRLWCRTRAIYYDFLLWFFFFFWINKQTNKIFLEMESECHSLTLNSAAAPSVQTQTPPALFLNPKLKPGISNVLMRRLTAHPDEWRVSGREHEHLRVGGWGWKYTFSPQGKGLHVVALTSCQAENRLSSTGCKNCCRFPY